MTHFYKGTSLLRGRCFFMSEVPLYLDINGALNLGVRRAISDAADVPHPPCDRRPPAVVGVNLTEQLWHSKSFS